MAFWDKRKIKTLGLGEMSGERLREDQVWVWIHCIDYDEPWYDDCDEEDYRVYSGGYPIKEDSVYGEAKINNSTHIVQIVNYMGEENENVLINYQPQIWIDDEWYELWHGNVYQFGSEWLDDAYEGIKKVLSDQKSFEITVDPQIFGKEIKFTVDGLGFFADEDDTIEIKKF